MEDFWGRLHQAGRMLDDTLSKTPAPHISAEAMVEQYRTLAYDAERAGQLKRADELRATARTIAAMTPEEYARWYNPRGNKR